MIQYDMFKYDPDKLILIFDINRKELYEQFMELVKSPEKHQLDVVNRCAASIGFFLAGDETVKESGDICISNVHFFRDDNPRTYEEGRTDGTWCLCLAHYAMVMTDMDGNILFDSGKEYGYKPFNDDYRLDELKSCRRKMLEVIHTFGGRNSGCEQVTTDDEIVF